MLAEQTRTVARLSACADERRRLALGYRHRLSRWKRRKLGTPEALAIAFAAGTAAGVRRRGKPMAGKAFRHTVVAGLANFAMLASRLLPQDGQAQGPFGPGGQPGPETAKDVGQSTPRAD